MSRTVVKQLWENTSQRTVLLMALAVTPVLALSIARFDVIFVLAAIIAVVAATLAFLWPELATISVTFAVFANLPAIATRFHGVPKLASAAVVLLLFLPLIDLLIRKKQAIIVDQTTRLILLLAAVFTLSGLFAIDFSTALAAVLEMLTEGLLLFWLLLNVIRSRATLNRVIWTLLITGAFLGSLAVYQRFTNFSTDFGGLAQSHTSRSVDLPGAGYEERGAERTEGPVGETNRFAQIMLVLLPLAYFRFRFSENQFSKMAAVSSAFLILSAMALTYSRGAFLNLILLLGVAALLREISTRKLLMGGVALLILVLLIAPGYLDRIKTLTGVQGIVSEESQDEADGSMKGRMTEMLAAFNVFIDHPILGVGPGHYMQFYSKDYHLSLESALRYLPRERRAHNLYLEIAAESGLIGITVFLLILFSLLYQLFQLRRFWKEEDPEAAGLATAFLFAILTYMGTGMFLHLAYQRYFWMLLALSAVCVRILKTEKPQPKASFQEQRLH
ncbi:MAG: O-antigen ligase family protein [Acidobacteriota bacterium]|nr:MAG: O-antigen ligase family protein [Acidobacteriota bacterium]